RVPLPTYAFQRERHWVDFRPSPRSSESPRDAAAWASWLHAITWKHVDSPVRSSSMAADWVIFADRDAAAGRLADALTAEGCRAIVLRPGSSYERSAEGATIAPDSRADLDRAWNEFGLHGRAFNVVHAWALDAGDARDVSPSGRCRTACES